MEHDDVLLDVCSPYICNNSNGRLGLAAFKEFIDGNEEEEEVAVL